MLPGPHLYVVPSHSQPHGRGHSRTSRRQRVLKPVLWDSLIERTFGGWTSSSSISCKPSRIWWPGNELTQHQYIVRIITDLYWLEVCSCVNLNHSLRIALPMNINWIRLTSNPPRLGNSMGRSIDILYTVDSASNYSAIQKLKPWLQTQDIPMKWEDSYGNLNIKLNLFQIHFQTIQMMKVIVVF
jgi:hypothetical protein